MKFGELKRRDECWCEAHSAKAVLAASTPALRREMLNLTVSAVAEDAELAKDRRFVDDILSETEKDGYAWSAGGSEASISAIALECPLTFLEAVPSKGLLATLAQRRPPLQYSRRDPGAICAAARPSRRWGCPAQQLCR